MGMSAPPSQGLTAREPVRTAYRTGSQGNGPQERAQTTTSGLCLLFRSAPSLLPSPARQPSGFPRNEVGPPPGLTLVRGPAGACSLAEEPGAFRG
ncbi:hypothetical protein STEG23_005336 [Scotinomys teguina]